MSVRFAKSCDDQTKHAALKGVASLTANWASLSWSRTLSWKTVMAIAVSAAFCPLLAAAWALNFCCRSAGMFLNCEWRVFIMLWAALRLSRGVPVAGCRSIAMVVANLRSAQAPPALCGCFRFNGPKRISPMDLLGNIKLTAVFAECVAGVQPK